MISLEIIHQARLVKIQNFNLNKLITLDVNKEEREMLELIGWADDDLNTRLINFIDWSMKYLSGSRICTLFRRSTLEDLITIKSTLVKDTDSFKTLIPYLEHYINIKNGESSLLKPFSFNRLITTGYNYLVSLLTLDKIEFAELDKKFLVMCLMNLRKNMGLTKSLTRDNRTLNYVKYGFNEYTEIFTSEVIRELIQETIVTIDTIGIPTNSDIEIIKNHRIPIALQKMYNRDNIETEAFALSLVTTVPRDKVFLKTYMRTWIEPLRKTPDLDTEDLLLQFLDEAYKNDLNPKVARDLIFGKGFLYRKEWTEIIRLLNNISEEKKEYEQLIQAILKSLYLSDELYNIPLSRELKQIDSRLGYLRNRRPRDKELIKRIVTKVVELWNAYSEEDKIEYNESLVIRNDRLDTKYVGRIISELDIKLNEIRYSIELSGSYTNDIYK